MEWNHAMRMFERLVCNLIWLVWVGSCVGRPGVRPEEAPRPPDDSGAAGKCLYPDRTILPY
jgi:hypothetical protein